MKPGSATSTPCPEVPAFPGNPGRPADKNSVTPGGAPSRHRGPLRGQREAGRSEHGKSDDHARDPARGKRHGRWAALAAGRMLVPCQASSGRGGPDARSPAVGRDAGPRNHLDGVRLVMKGPPVPPRKQRLGRTAGLPRTGGNRRPTRDVGLSGIVRGLVMARDHWACTCCGMLVAQRPHSVLRRSPDAGDSPANLLTFLGDGSRPRDPADHCARVDSCRDPADAARGFRVPSGHDPALVPVMVSTGATRSWVTLWLTANGPYSTEPPPGAD